MSEETAEEMKFENHMSDAEALMWNLEKDPWLNPSGGVLAMLSGPVDVENFRVRMRYAVANIPRLRQRVVPSLGRLSPPSWVPDPEFDFDFHVRHMALPAPGSLDSLLKLATRLQEDPFDRTRPLWLFVVIDGLADGRSALFMKLHHTISDGIGAVKLAEIYMTREANAPLPPAVDLQEVLAKDVAEAEAEQLRLGADLGTSVTNAANSSFGHFLRRQAGLARRLAGEVALWTADPTMAREAADALISDAKSAVSQLSAPDDVDGGSPIWKQRSRRRSVQSLRLPLGNVKMAGRVLGGSVNDFFMTGAINGAVKYHEKRGVSLNTLRVSFVVSTRSETSSGSNAFTPVKGVFPATPMTPVERFNAVHEVIHRERSGVRGGGILGELARVANLLPTSALARFARAQAANLDFATSNLPAAPFPMHISGAQIQEMVVFGPVAGTAFNLTTMSYNGSLEMGLHYDPTAVEDGADLRDCMVEAYDELFAAALSAAEAAGLVNSPPAKQVPTEKAAIKKRSGEKTPAAKKPAVKKNLSATKASPARKVPAAKTSAAKAPAAKKAVAPTSRTRKS